MKCSVCKADINEKPLFRANKKGEPAIFQQMLKKLPI